MRVLAVLFCLPLGLISAYNFTYIFSGSPAFDKSTRVEGVFGDWRLPLPAAYYDQSEYLFQLGYGLVQSDALISGVTEAGDEVASEEIVQERAQRAAGYLRKSLLLAPGNAHAWTSLAWADALGGDMEPARRAMEASWSLAVYNLDMSTDRLAFFELISEDVAATDATKLTDAEKRGAINDLETLALHNPNLLSEIIDFSPDISELAKAAGILKDVVN